MNVPNPRKPEKETITICAYCGVGCGFKAETIGDEIEDFLSLLIALPPCPDRPQSIARARPESEPVGIAARIGQFQNSLQPVRWQMGMELLTQGLGQPTTTRLEPDKIGRAHV
jgi:hypothetical protein